MLIFISCWIKKLNWNENGHWLKINEMRWKHEKIFCNCLTQSQHGRKGLYSVSHQRTDQALIWKIWADLEHSISSHWKASLHCLEETQQLAKAHAKRMPSSQMVASEHPQKAQWFSSVATWGMQVTVKLQKPQLSENGPIPWKHLCSQTVNDRGGNALQPNQQYLICWACVSGPVPGGHGHLLSCDPVTNRLSVSPSGIWKRWKGGKNKGGNNSFFLGFSETL